MFTLNSIYLFGSLALIFKVVAPKAHNPKSANGKLKLWLSPYAHTIQAWVVPSAWLLSENAPRFTGEAVREGELEACSPHCTFRADKGGGCYVRAPYEVKGAVTRARRELRQAPNGIAHTLTPFNYELRLTVWGDVSRLPQEALDEVVRPLLELAGGRLAYTAGWREPRMQTLAGLMCASTQSLKDASEAVALGWLPYHGEPSQEEELRALLRKQGLSAYRCPVKGGDRSNKIGCANCPIKCNGERAVIAHTK